MFGASSPSVTDPEFVPIPGGPFLLGAEYSALPDKLRRADAVKSLGLGAVLASTPPCWIDIPEFAIMPRMVSNGQYQRFWDFVHPNQPDLQLVDEIQIWEYVWQLYPLQTVRVPGGSGQLSEDYTGCQTAIDALTRSYAYEAQRLLLDHHVPAAQSGYDDLSRALVSLFACLRRGLAAVIWPGAPQLERGEAQALARDEDTITRHVRDLDLVAKALEQKIDQRGNRLLGLAILLRRMRSSLLDPEREDLSFRVSSLFRPLTWQDDGVPARTGGLFVSRVPWSDLPVVGISLYEAAAYAAWLRLTTGKPVTLPSEAEYERAFGWPSESVPLQPELKHVYPWQAHNDQDFNYWFSRDGTSLLALEARPAAYRELMEASSRPVGDARLYQGLGFGWQWTRERFNELERKYNRFEFAGVRSWDIDGVRVSEYKDCVDHTCRFFTVRGAPDQLGGPGVVTRRFALNPLRGSRECGFRCVTSPAGEF